IFATHGHVYSPLKPDGNGCVVDGSRLPHLSGVDVMLYGHTHIQELREQNGVKICNPGSVSIPKNGQKPGYAVWDNGELLVMNY
ncbi:MAG: metallophosphoesterase family protein, partial [Bacteroidales bacterium]|nr:metallophosphoesterase family protein [Bacteroidales bacterium]